MGDESPRFDTTAIIRGFAASDDVSLVECMFRYKGMLVCRANRLLRTLMIDWADPDGEGAVDLAFGRLCQLRRRGVLDTIRDSDDLLKLMLQEVSWLIKNQKTHSEAVKRGAEATQAMGRQEDAFELVTKTKTHHRRIEVDLDQLVSGESPVEDVVVASLELEVLLDRLPDDDHRTILTMRCEGYSIKEIALRLGVVRRTIERKLKKIEDVYFKCHSGT